MVKRKIVWSLRAQQDRLQILDYWIVRNKSAAYSRKLYRTINSAVELLADYPEIGRLTNISGIRAKVVKDYLIIYQDDGKHLNILTIWDSRQDPDKLDKIIGGDN